MIGRLHPRGEAPAVRPHLAAHHPAVVLRRGVGHERQGHRVGVAPGDLGGGPAAPGRGPGAQQRARRSAGPLVIWRSGTNGRCRPPEVAVGADLGRAGEARPCAAPAGAASTGRATARVTAGCIVGMDQAIQPPQPCPTTGAPGLAQRPDDAGDVGGEGEGVVAARRLVGGAVAAQVHRGDAVAGVGEAGQLVAPGPPELREAVQQHHERPLALLGHVEAGAVGGDEPVLPRARR